MRSRHAIFIVALIGRLVVASPPDDLDPQIRTEQNGVHLELVAEHPLVMTPTGIDTDDDGNLWVVVSHTHFRPDDYDGPEHDQVLVFPTGGAGEPEVFFDQTDATMDLELGSDGWVYLAERDRILRVRDGDGDGDGDTVEEVASLKTDADYPHNGLSGLAWHPSGDLVFALGENYWRPWELTGADGNAIQGTGEGGIFRCRPDGSGLRRVARGFWNPFGVCVRSDGTMFAAENDPGARPPCRLLHVVEGGDYGYQRLYGNAPYHPFVCWDGELRGTLPMLHPVGEAPCGIAPLANGLLVTSWTEHRVDFYPLTPAGAGFETQRVTLVQGGSHFRPTCITQASPTTFYMTDWVFGSYEIHQRGRIWKLEIDPDESWVGRLKLDPPTEDARRAAAWIAGSEQPEWKSLLASCRDEDPYLRHASVMALARRCGDITEAQVKQLETQDQLSVLLALRRHSPQRDPWVRFFWGIDHEDVRFEALRWIADEQLISFKEDIRSLIESPAGDTRSYRIFEAALAAWNTLSGNPRTGIADPAMLIERVTAKEPANTRAYALRLLDPKHPRFTPELWRELLSTRDPVVVTELVRAVARNGSSDAQAFLATFASNETHRIRDRADAITGLSAASSENVRLLLRLANTKQRSLREESLRSLRFASMDDASKLQLDSIADRYPQSADLVAAVVDPKSVQSDRPPSDDLKAWQKRLASIEAPVDPDAGRRVFHHASVGTCIQCHRYQGRGNVVGPDLSAVSNLGDRDRLLRALLQPSVEIDPQYYPHVLLTDDGKVFTGLLLRDGGGGREVYRDNMGRERAFQTSSIVQRKQSTKSMMPEGLIDLMTDREIRDLLVFLDRRER